MLPEEWDCPFDRLVTKRLGTIGHAGAKDVLEILIPNRGTISSAVVHQRAGPPISLKALDPMVDGHPAGPQEPRDLCDRTTIVDFEDGKDTAEQPRVPSRS